MARAEMIGDFFGLCGWGSSSIALADRTSTSRHVEPQADVDRDLLDRVLGGDPRAARELFHRHVDEVYRRLTHLVGPDPEREDLVQEVFTAAFRGLGRFRRDATFSTWLYRIIVHTAYGHLRRRRKRSFDLGVALESVSVDPRESPEATADRREQVRRALRLLDRLKPKKRIAFVLRVVDGLSLTEIALLVDATPAAVGQRVKHAQGELEVMIARESRRDHSKGGRS